MKNKNNLLALVSLTLALPGALHAFSQEKDGIKISVKDFMNDPYAQVINNPKWTITAEELQKNNIAAIKVKVTNNTDKPIFISGRSVKLLQATPADVTAKFKKRELLPPFLLACVSGVVGTGFFGKMILETVFDLFDEIPEFKDDNNILHTVINDPLHENHAAVMIIINNAASRMLKIIGITTLTGLGSALVYWLYVKDLNNQLNIALKQSILDELITIAPNQSIEKVILCNGMMSQNFNFHIFNRSQVPVAEFTVDLRG